MDFDPHTGMRSDSSASVCFRLITKTTTRVFQEDSLYEHFVTVADACPAPLVVYNMVPVTGIDLSVGVLKKMAAHPNIVGVKDKDVSARVRVRAKRRSLSRRADVVVCPGVHGGKKPKQSETKNSTFPNTDGTLCLKTRTGLRCPAVMLYIRTY